MRMMSVYVEKESVYVERDIQRIPNFKEKFIRLWKFV